ncbi:valyl-tRNA ligase [Candidatus Mycoplasma haematolamae str. Purdue]|uniref:Valine--tRNA ligase n=1 Tax=Mycoplasma haematolamae (strain Purdue) TaxID=1212765 RepID=I7BA91_MYCHA|nr:valine--tRNA ligase [Candidatus Mycoplasma haematolamae]AFO52210.1 valyl-tRNA ligase [Candidatus Mycoplasma haematolamae str. Purdue]
MGFHSLLLPPPNLTGVLHLGHLWNIILQDFRFKWEGMRKHANYWAIGVDHAGLSFQSKFDSLFGSRLSKENKEEYLSEMHKYASQLKETILEQFKSISSSLPVERSRYTLEEDSQKFVVDKFLTLFSQGLIYKKKKLVNWDISLQEVLADCECTYRETTSKLYCLKYLLVDDPSRYLLVATSRPETVFGDVAVFVNPEDERYSSFLNKKVLVPGVSREVPVLSDSLIDRDFGTGCMKCTPSHDKTDWLLREKHSLKSIQIFDEQGIFLDVAGRFKGRDRLEARGEIVEWLDSLSLLERIEDYETKLVLSEKSNTLVEYLVTEQWFLSSSVLAAKAAEAIREGLLKLNIYPESQRERLLYYLDNMEDWCISRQILWGIKIPMVYDTEFRQYRANKRATDPSKEIEEEIVLDTWFSSALWPVIVFEGRPRERSQFFPFTTLISGKDILLPWVSRMIFLSLHFYSKFPFKNVFLHGLLRNNKGEKMSKSLGNGILPEELYKKYSSDVIRLAFLSSTHYDRDLRYSESIFQKSGTFIHKLEHMFNFFLSKLKDLAGSEDLKEPIVYKFEKLSWAERWILREFSLLGNQLEKIYSEYDYFSLFKEVIKFFSEKLSNQFLELLKFEGELSENSLKFLAYLWRLSCRILYPFVPEFSRKSYRKIFKEELKGTYPNRFYPEKISSNPARYEWFFTYMREVRRLYTALSMTFNQEVKLNIVLEGKDASIKSDIGDLSFYFRKLNHSLNEFKSSREGGFVPTIKIGKNYFELLFDSFPIDRYRKFIDKEIEKYSFEISRSKEILSRDTFKANAPAELVKKETSKYRHYLSEHKFYKEMKERLLKS